MPRATWTFHQGRPRIQIELMIAATSQWLNRDVIADTGAGNDRSTFELILAEPDCLLSGGVFSHFSRLGGAYSGTFPVYIVRVAIPLLGFDHDIRAVGVRSTPSGFDGLACFPFLNRFNYGNFGDRKLFGLET